jgi:hypothetical protein
MEASYSTVLDRVEEVLERHRRGPDPPTQQEIDDVYTDACATLLLLEGERASVERRLSEAAAAGADDATVIRTSRDLARRRVQIDDNLLALRMLTHGLSSAVNGSRHLRAVGGSARAAR